MYEQIEKTKGNKSRVIANSVTQNKNDVKQGFGIVTNRPEAIAQRKLKTMINKNFLIRLVSYRSKCSSSPQLNSRPLQRVEAPWSLKDEKNEWRSGTRLHSYADAVSTTLGAQSLLGGTAYMPVPATSGAAAGGLLLAFNSIVISIMTKKDFENFELIKMRLAVEIQLTRMGEQKFGGRVKIVSPSDEEIKKLFHYYNTATGNGFLGISDQRQGEANALFQSLMEKLGERSTKNIDHEMMIRDGCDEEVDLEKNYQENSIGWVTQQVFKKYGKANASLLNRWMILNGKAPKKKR